MNVNLEKKGLAKPVTITRGALLYAVLAILLSTLTMSILGVVYSDHQRREADHRWCTLFAVIDRPVDPKIKDPAQRARTQQTVNLMHDLRVSHGCVKE